MNEQNFLLAYYKGFFARISYDEPSTKWIGRVLDVDDLMVFDGDTIEEILATFHEGLETYLSVTGNLLPHQFHSQTYNMIRYGIEERPFMEAARELLHEEGEL